MIGSFEYIVIFLIVIVYMLIVFFYIYLAKTKYNEYIKDLNEDIEII